MTRLRAPTCGKPVRYGLIRWSINPHSGTHFDLQEVELFLRVVDTAEQKGIVRWENLLDRVMVEDFFTLR